MNHILSSFMSDSCIQYPCGRLYGKYIDSNEYTLPAERVPDWLSNWADTKDKRELLRELSVYDSNSNEIKRRKSFKTCKFENLWDISDKTLVDNFLYWVYSTFRMPIIECNQVRILEKLFEIRHIGLVYSEVDFSSSTEWDNERYQQWKKHKNVTIKIVDGKLPCRGIYNNVYLFKSQAGEYTYFTSSNTIYISSEKEPASILAEVYNDRTIPFTKDDWNDIFLVSVDALKEKDEEIQRLRNRLHDLENLLGHTGPEVIDHGTIINKDNNDEKARSEINKEARYEAKDYLESIDYDCSEWDVENSSQVVERKIKYNGKYIVVAILSSRRGKLYLHPYVFAKLMESPDNLLLNYGPDRRIHTLSFNDIFKDNPNVNLIFDTDVINPKEIAKLANEYMYSKRTCFVVANISYSQSEAIKSFGLDEKIDNGVIKTDASINDIFNIF